MESDYGPLFWATKCDFHIERANTTQFLSLDDPSEAQEVKSNDYETQIPIIFECLQL